MPVGCFLSLLLCTLACANEIKLLKKFLRMYSVHVAWLVLFSKQAAKIDNLYYTAHTVVDDYVN